MKQSTLNKTKEVVELGTFEIVSGVVRISDPCYDKKTWCAGKITDVLNGTWKAQVIKKKEVYEYVGKVEAWAKGQSFTDHCNVLIAVHESFDKLVHTDKRLTTINGGMDAGMAGIFDDKFYKKNYKKDYFQVGRLEYDYSSTSHYRTHDVEHAQAMLDKSKQISSRKELIPIYEEMLAQANDRLTNPKALDYSKAAPTRDWYEICCDKSLSNVGAGVIDYGVVSSSGYGDGGYSTYAVYNQDGRVVGIKLRF